MFQYIFVRLFIVRFNQLRGSANTISKAVWGPWGTLEYGNIFTRDEA